MDIRIKQVSSLETIFTYDKAEEVSEAYALQGERFSYQVVVVPSKSYRYEIKLDAPKIADYITIYKARNAVMDFPFSGIDENSDLLTKTPELVPDILVSLESDKNNITLHKDTTQVFWIRTDIPEDFPEGIYPITLNFIPLAGHSWDPIADKSSVITFNLEVLPIKIPKQDLIYTQWFYADCIADYYEVPVYSEKHWDLIDKYIKTAVDTGVNMILTPIISPPLDTAKGIYRTNVQLVDIKVQDNKYLFDCSKLERWIDICKKNGVKYFEMAQLFSQWGLKYTPGIVANVNGKQEYIFGWHIESKSPEYAKFLNEFVPHVVDCLKKKGVYENTYFHISDEPGEHCLDIYKYASLLLKPLIGSAKLLEALSNYEFYQNGLVDIPVTDVAHMKGFLGKDVKEQWVYYAEDVNGISIRHLSAPAYRNRILGLQLYKYNIKGFLHWGYNFYNTALSYHKINPYLTTSGDKTLMSGGAFSVYPSANGPLISARTIVFYEGLQDLAICNILEQYVGKNEVIRIIEEQANMELTFWEYPRDSAYLPQLRNRLIQELKLQIIK